MHGCSLMHDKGAAQIINLILCYNIRSLASIPMLIGVKYALPTGL